MTPAQVPAITPEVQTLPIRAAEDPHDTFPTDEEFAEAAGRRGRPVEAGD